MNPRFKALTDQIRAIIGQDLKRQDNFNQVQSGPGHEHQPVNVIVKKQENNLKMEDTKSIMDQYLQKSETTQEDNENAYSKLV